VTKDHPSECSTSAGRSAQDHFAPTRWTAVLSAGHADTTRARQALAELCQTYWYPLYAYVRRRGYSSHDAEDLTQGFFARLLRLNSLAEVSPGRGKFRAFLLASIKNYLLVEWRRASAQKRDVRRTFSFDLDAAEIRYHQEPFESFPPEWVFDRQWALTLLERVIQQLRREYELSGRGTIFQELRQTITLGRELVSHEDLAARLGMSEEAVRVAAHRLRKRYRQMLRAEIAGTVSDESEVDAEMDYLRRVITPS
jgi:RNA polymerase sigma factor (sigma-70 family)